MRYDRTSPRQTAAGVKMSDVAALANVSESTVSHVLNGTRYVADDTREAVLDAVRRTGYVRNTIARSLVTSKTHTIGLAASSVSNPYFGALVQSIQKTAEPRGYTLLIVDTHDDPEREARVVRDLHERRVDGILLTPSADAHVALDYLRQQSVPIVLVDRMTGAPCDQVGSENVESTASLVEHLADAGHRRIALISGLPGLATTDERIEGYRLGARRRRLRLDRRYVVSGRSDAEGGCEAVRQLLDLRERPSALIVGNNHMTIGAMRGLRDSGVIVPDDMALVGFDDFEWADLFSPRLTAVAQPYDDIAAEAVRLLLSRLDDREQPPRQVRLQPTFVHRDSCGCERGVDERTASS